MSFDNFYINIYNLPSSYDHLKMLDKKSLFPGVKSQTVEDTTFIRDIPVKILWFHYNDLSLNPSLHVIYGNMSKDSVL